MTRKSTQRPTPERPASADVSKLQAEITLRDSQITEATRRYEDMRQRYEGLLRVLSQQTNESASSHSDLHDLSMPYAADENADLEIQQWGLMWTHLISMITQVIEYREITAKSGIEKRAVLVDIIGKLCQAASAPKETEAHARLQKKYVRTKQALKKLKAQGEMLLQEVERHKQVLEAQLNEFSARDERKLASQIRQLHGLLKQQLASQAEFLRHDAGQPLEPAPVVPRRKSLPRDDDTDFTPVRSPVARARVTPKRRPPPVDEDESDEVAPPISKSSVLEGSSHRLNTSRQRREVAEREADEVLRKRGGKRKEKGESQADVNQLIDLTNQLRNDYRKLGQLFGGEVGRTDLSIEELSRLNDSLLNPSAVRDVGFD
jgi:hypothetical protein